MRRAVGRMEASKRISVNRAALIVLIGWALGALLLATQPSEQQQVQPRQAQQQPPPRRQLVRKYKRPSNLPKASARIMCPICASDFMSKRVTIDDACFNPRYDLATAELELITECPLATRNCTTDTVYINGVLASVKRKCGQPNSCTDACVVAGFGLTSKTCQVCCPPFEFDSYNTDYLKKPECA